MNIRLVLLIALAFSTLCILSACTSTTTSGESVFLSDEELVADVKARLDDDDVTSKFRFGTSAEAGKVTLRGTIYDTMARRRAISIALGTPGVREVVDECYPQ